MITQSDFGSTGALLIVSYFCNCFLSTLLCLDNSVCHLGNDQLYSTDSVVVARDYIIQLFRITVGISKYR